MAANELLIRTMNAAKEARARGFENTAIALDEIVDNLLETLNSRTQSLGEERANPHPLVQQIH